MMGVQLVHVFFRFVEELACGLEFFLELIALSFVEVDLPLNLTDCLGRFDQPLLGGDVLLDGFQTLRFHLVELLDLCIGGFAWSDARFGDLFDLFLGLADPS